MKILWTILFALLLGCSSSQQERKAIYLKDLGPSKRFKTKGLIVQSFDLNGDQIADLWKIFEEVQKHIDDLDPQLHLLRKEMDSNFDLKIDTWYIYDDEENIAQILADTDFDGMIDMVEFYGKESEVESYGEGLKEKSERQVLIKRAFYLIPPGYEGEDSKPIKVKYYRKGKAYKIERDTNGDGKIDRWEIFVKGRLKQVGIDEEGNGNVRWERYD